MFNLDDLTWFVAGGVRWRWTFPAIWWNVTAVVARWALCGKIPILGLTIYWVITITVMHSEESTYLTLGAPTWDSQSNNAP